MAVFTNYFTTGSPTVLAGLVMQSEARVRVGLYRLYAGSLETTSAAYTQLGASLGLVAGNSFDLGELASLGFEYVPTFEVPDTANVLNSSLQILGDEEVTISMGVRQFDPRLMEVAMRAGTMYELGNGRLITVGGKCAETRRPIEIGVTNIGCNAPATPESTLTGVTAIVITAYDCGCMSGLAWSDIIANELNVLDLEFEVFPVNAKALGNRLFNILLF